MQFQSINLTSFFTTCIFIFLLSGCQKKQNINNKQPEIYKLKEFIAKLIDIPDVLMQCKIKKIIESEEDLGQFQIICDCNNINQIDLTNYYKAEMERLGWNLQSIYDETNEVLLVFLKPSGSTCVISLREKNQLYITIMNKKDIL